MTRTIGFLCYDELQAFDLAGPFDAFGAANACAGAGEPPYRMVTIGVTDQPIRAENGLTLVPDLSLERAPQLDTLVLPGGRGGRKLAGDARLDGWIRARAADTRRVVTICTGIYLVAATGLLDGRRATTHWRYADDVRRRFPAIHLEADRLHVSDGVFHTSGGLSAGLDLVLALVEADLGPEVALASARHLVMYMKRPGNQAQFSEPLRAQVCDSGPLAGLLDWLLAHLDEDLSLTRMAAQVNMSERNFCRVFKRTFGGSPARFLERMRAERSKILLISTPATVERIAARVGFESADAFRRAFRRLYGASPREYRQRFG
ncbi:MAG: GlxA family transcriptional regulator [Gammaproteobacteria bacterium]